MWETYENLDETTKEIVTSVVVLSVTFSLAELGRNLLLPANLPKENLGADVPMKYVLLTEFFMTIERTVAVNEMSVSIHTNHKLTILLIMAVILHWFYSRWPPTKSSIARHMKLLQQEKTTCSTIALHISVEILSGILAFPFLIRPLWLLMRDDGVRVHLLSTHCPSNLQTTGIQGFAVEFSGTFLCGLLAMSLPYLVDDVRIYYFIYGFCASTATVLGVPYTGGFYDPPLATIFEIGCRGSTFLTFIQVYWVAPILGTVASTHTFKKYGEAYFQRRASTDEHED